MLVIEDDLTGLTSGVWDAFLGLPIDDAYGAELAAGPVRTSCVNISGSWSGSVALVIPEPLATLVAGAMFGLEADELTDVEISDAVGELANIIGGNIKGLIDGPCSLSLPMVASGENYSVTVPGTQLVSQVSLESEGHVFRVSVSSSTV